MRAAAIAFLLGVIATLCLPSLPELGVAQAWLLVAAALLSLFQRLTRPVAFLLGGGAYAALACAQVLDSRLPRELEAVPVLVTGRVVTLPQRDRVRQRFRLRADDATSADGEPLSWGRGALLQLAWYERGAARSPLLRGGDRVRLAVKLKRPRGLVNPAGFDYERWLFAERVAATGYVLRALETAPAPSPSLLGARAWLSARLHEAGADAPGGAVVQALALGIRDGLGAAQWEVLRGTGTGHLIAISGLHVGMLALLGFGVGRWLWVRCAALPRRLPAQRAAAVLALLLAVCYAALAGFTLPTQRALVMVSVFALAVAARRQVAPSAGLCAALLVVLLLDPLAPLAPGFWLSFAATAVLLYFVAGRRRAVGGRVRLLAQVQLAVALGLAPVALGVFGQQPMLSPLANLLAIPWTGWVVVPLSLLGTVAAAFAPAVATPLLWLAGWSVQALFLVLDLLASVGQDLQLRMDPSPLAVAAAAVGVLLLLLPRGTLLRWLGIPWLMPLALYAPAAPAPGSLQVAVLDAGQGLTVLVRTSHHALLYDAGPRFGERFDTGRAVVLPYLRQLRADVLDVMLLSHDNADHTGGAAAVHAGATPSRVLHNRPLDYVATEPCVAGKTWWWDGYRFELLHPPPLPVPVPTDNDGSCVLRVSGPGGAVLLPGDVEAPAERRLLATGWPLAADLLVVPHHGSRSSTTQGLVDAVGPSLAVFATGYRNRYGFPAAEVRARLWRSGARLLDTGRDGAVLVTLVPGAAPLVRRLRAERKAIWREP